jgi:hypothetical protein
MIRDRDELEQRAGSEIHIPRRYLDVHAFFFGPPSTKRPRRYCAATTLTT